MKLTRGEFGWAIFSVIAAPFAVLAGVRRKPTIYQGRQEVTPEVLRILSNNVQIAKASGPGFNFESSGARMGATLMVRKPARWGHMSEADRRAFDEKNA